LPRIDHGFFLSTSDWFHDGGNRYPGAKSASIACCSDLSIHSTHDGVTEDEMSKDVSLQTLLLFPGLMFIPASSLASPQITSKGFPEASLSVFTEATD
jgi:hypothetical protein